MQRLRSSYFPDVNVWLALTYRRHVHQAAAWTWLESLGRLLTTEAIMGSDGVMSQRDAWAAYDRWLQDERVEFQEEPPGLDFHFRSRTQHGRPSPKAWMDGYLAAFASLAGLPLVTFDQGLRGQAEDLLVLES
jgi:predicted nucleic acid-binding protein